MKTNAMIRDFFDKHILPLHERLRAGEIKYLEEEFNTSRESYFSDIPHTQHHSLNTLTLQDISEVESLFQTLWKDEPDLLKLIPDLAKLAFKLKEEKTVLSSELSASLYVMF